MEIISPSCTKQAKNQYDKMALPSSNPYSTLSQQDISVEFQQNYSHQHHQQPSIYLKIFFAYLYFTQGVIISLCSTMPYVYPELPSYDIMAVFNVTLLPFSFKFLIAPFIQKYTLFNYGKRKFWIVLSQTATSLCLFASAFLTHPSQSYSMAVALLIAILFLTFQDISLDSLAKKQLIHAHITTSVSITFQLTGVIFGSMVLLKLTSIQFSKDIGLNQPITNAKTIIFILSLLVFIPSVLIHFYFKETKLRRQYESIQNSLSEIFCSYRAFFIWKSKYFRTIILLMLMNQGFNFFNAGYSYELIKAGFSRNTSNTIDNIMAIPINIIACYASQKVQSFGLKKGLLCGMLLQLVVYSYLRIFFPLNVLSVAISSFTLGLFSMWTLMIGVIFGYELPIHPYTGMFLTVVMSANNLGNNLFIHTKILSWWSWWVMSWVGIGIQLMLALWVYFYLYDWKDEGMIELEEILREGSDNSDLSSNNSKEMEMKGFDWQNRTQLRK